VPNEEVNRGVQAAVGDQIIDPRSDTIDKRNIPVDSTVFLTAWKPRTVPSPGRE